MFKRFALAALIASSPLVAHAQVEDRVESTAPPGARPSPSDNKNGRPATPPPVGRETGSARREAERILREAGAVDLFANISEGETVRVRHKRSGMVCEFDVGDRGARIVVFEQGLRIQRGDDVGCARTYSGIAQTFYATRYPDGMSAQTALSRAVGEITQRWPDLRRYQGDVAEVSPDRTGKPPLPETLLAHFVVRVNGIENYSAVRVVEYNGWVLKQRVTASMDRARNAQFLGAAFWMAMVVDVIDNGQVI